MHLSLAGQNKQCQIRWKKCCCWDQVWQIDPRSRKLAIIISPLPSSSSFFWYILEANDARLLFTSNSPSNIHFQLSFSAAAVYAQGCQEISRRMRPLTPTSLDVKNVRTFYHRLRVPSRRLSCLWCVCVVFIVGWQSLTTETFLRAPPIDLTLALQWLHYRHHYLNSVSLSV